MIFNSFLGSALQLWSVTLLCVGTLLYLYRNFFSSFSLSGKHVLITGGSEGLGLAYARLAARQGARVSLVSRSEDKLRAAAKSVAAAAPSASVCCHSADVTDSDAVSAAFAACRAQHQEIDVLVCNAGYAYPAYLKDTPQKHVEGMLNVNVLGAINCAKEVVESMVRRKAGRIVLVGSTMSFTAFTGFAAYAASKWALRGLAGSLRNELSPFGVKVQMYVPTTMDTPGLERENRTKPPPTLELEDGALTMTANEAAARLHRGMARGSYVITADWITEVMRCLCLSSDPGNNFFFEWLLSPLFVPIGLLLKTLYDNVAKKHAKTFLKKGK